MMPCPACAADSPPGARFCAECGVRLVSGCPGCGYQADPAAKFCQECGSPLGGAPANPTPPTPQTYTPRHLAEKILAGRNALTGERKQVTVLFADVVGSTDLIRDRDPEDAQRLLDGAVERMMAAVHRYEGTVSRLMGDGLMAMFGAPVAHEDHAVRACYAALAMLEAIRAYADEARQTHGATIQIRVGLNSGEVIVRLISDDLHMDYTAMGQTVHLASRMEGLAQAGTGLLSPSTLALVEGFVEVRPLGPTPVKGLTQPIDIYELVGVGALRSRLQAAAARGLTPLVGREDELVAIGRALGQAHAGRGQLVALVAEAGVGKSRLVWEATHAETANGMTVLQAGAVSYGQTTAWLPVSDLLRTLFQIESRDDHATMREKVSAHLQGLDPALSASLPALLALLDVPVEDATWAAFDPSQRRRATLDGVRQLLLRESQRRPLLLVVEDLHWIDSETQALLDSLVELLPTASILLLVNYRPEYTHTWANKSVYTQLRIDPLAHAPADALLDALLGGDPSTQPLRGLLIRRTEGTPLFLEESVRALVETGALVGERGAYRLAHPVEEIRVPATVQAVLAARIDRLSPSEKRLLQTASAIGKDVPFRLLQAIADVPENELQADLTRLQAAELVYPLSLFPEPEYTFKHALTHDVAYGSLLQERRKSLHARVVDAIEAVYADRLDEHVERLALHATRAEAWEKATEHSRLAGQRALSRSAILEAVTYLEQAVVAVDCLPDTREHKEQAIDVRSELRTALRLHDDEARGMQVLEEAEALAEAIGDVRRLAWAKANLAASLWIAGAYERAIELARRAMDIAEEVDDARLRAQTHDSIGLPLWGLGRYRESVAQFRTSLGIVTGLPFSAWPAGSMSVGGVMNMANLAWSLAELGEFDEARTHEQRAIRIAEANSSPYAIAGARNRAGSVGLRQGDAHRIVEGLERAFAICRAQDQPFMVPFAAGKLGAALVAVGRIREAIPILEEAAAYTRTGRALAEGSLWLGSLAEAYLIAGRPEDAHSVANEALAGTVGRFERGNEAWTRRLLGEIAASREPPDFAEAERQYHAALALAEDLGMRPLQAHCHLGLGKLYQRIGRLRDARTELTTAVAMLREMGMAFWLPEAEAALAAASLTNVTETGG